MHETRSAIVIVAEKVENLQYRRCAASESFLPLVTLRRTCSQSLAEGNEHAVEAELLTDS